MDIRVAVTGAGGFIGSHLVPKLKELGFNVIEISRNNGYDLNDWESIKNITRCNVIIHLAAKTFVPDSFNNPRDFYHSNITLTLNALELARKWGAKIVYMSSYFYGLPEYIPVDENHSVKPHNPYAQSKLISEELCKAYSRDFSVPVISFRLFNVYGPGQSGNFLIPEIFDKLKVDRKITLNDPRPKRDYIHVYDVVNFITKAIYYYKEGFSVFNLGTGSSISVGELVAIFNELFEGKLEIAFLHDYRKGEVLDSVADNRKLKETFGDYTFLDIKSGLNTFL